MTKRPTPPPDLDAFRSEPDLEKRNRLLLDWLDDEHRAALYDLINRNGGYLEFPSRDTGHRENESFGLQVQRAPINVGHKMVRLVTERNQIETILGDEGAEYSNRVYAELGGGSFMLALDPALDPASATGRPESCPAHKIQRAAYYECFADRHEDLLKVSHAACRAASIMAFKAQDLDLAAFAEQAAVRFCQKLMGYSFTDYPFLETQLRAAYRGLVHQVAGRHFVTDPIVLRGAREALGRLLTRTSKLIAAYAAADEDELKGCEDPDLTGVMLPMLRRLAEMSGVLNGEQRAVLAVGAIAGTVGNVQAAACIVVKALFASESLWEQARELALSESGEEPTGKFGAWKKLLQGPLRENPPIPLLPRLKIDGRGELQHEVILALGGGTAARPSTGDEDTLIWGQPGTHFCTGISLAWPLVVEIVRQVMRLPGLAQALDPVDATVIGLKKTWGFACDRYPLTYRREHRLVQSSLNVAMRLRSPVRESADHIREVIRAGAPRIEQLLRESRLVHFAWFELIENDSTLVLHTVYDGPFAAYVHHFALRAGDLFDALFAWIESPPPMPVQKFPNEFVAHIQRFDRGPLTGYFYSAYPKLDTANAVRQPLSWP